MEDRQQQQQQQQSQVLKALEALKKASKDLEINPSTTAADAGGNNSPSMKALLELETGSEDLMSGDPHLSTLSSLLSRLKSLASTHGRRLGLGLVIPSFLRRRSSRHEISRVAGSIGSEIQSWIDRESIDRLRSPATADDERCALLDTLESRLSQGFDPAFQDLLLRSAAFSAVESSLADPAASKRVRDRSAAAVLAMVRFNKNVFVGQVLMGPAVRSLVSMASPTSLRVLNGLISSIRSPIVDELHCHGEISKLISLLSASEIEIQVLALDTVLEIGYYGRKEAIDAMMEENLIKKLVELQQSDLGGASIETESTGEDQEEGKEEEEEEERGREKGFLEAHPFASCVARFAIQLEVGEGLRQREKRELKIEVVKRVKEAVVSDAEAATILAEVLWGSTPW